MQPLEKLNNSATLLLTIIVLLVVNCPIRAQESQSDDEVKLGLVLSGGGAKGFAHIGVLHVLEEENIPITLISGNSIGTIVGALYSIGYSAQEIEDFVREQNWEMLLLDKVPRKLRSPFKKDFEQKYLLQLSLSRADKKLSLPSGYVKGNNIYNLFTGITASIADSVHFAELPIPFACVAYNLEDGKEVRLTKGRLPKAMLSSMAIPGAFSPVNFNDMLLVDGGVINNFPVDVAKEMGADLIIGVDLKQKGDDDSHFGSISSVLKGIIDKIEIEKHEENSQNADVVINPKLDGVSTFDFKAEAVDSIIKSGERAAREQMPKIKELIKNRNIKRNNQDLSYNHKEKWLIKDIAIPEEYAVASRLIHTLLNIDTNSSYTIKEIDQAVERVFGYGSFDMVNYALRPNGDGYTLQLKIVKHKEESKVMFGAAFNTVELATLYGNFSRESFTSFINLLTLDTKIAVNPQIKLRLEKHRTQLAAFGLETGARFNKLNQYHDGHRFGKMDIINGFASLYGYKRYHNAIDMKVGLGQHYFNANAYSRSSGETLYSNTTGFYSTLFADLVVDTQDDIHFPKVGVYMNTNFTLLANKGKYSDLIPIYFLQTNTFTPLSSRAYLFADIYHRSIFNTNNPSLAFANYAANSYNSYSDYSIPVLGQPGISFLKPVSTMGELGLRVELIDKHYITPRFQMLWQLDDWKDIHFDSLNWSAGVTYQTATRLGPVDFTLGYQRNFNYFNFFGGVGYQF